MSPRRLLAVDVGGTKTLLSLSEERDGELVEVASERVASRGEDTPLPMLEAFCEAHPGALDAIGIGVAGPVSAGRCIATNLPWVVDASAIEAALEAPCELVNDFVASALGIGALSDDALVTLAPGEPDASAPSIVIGAGTGLGEAILLPPAPGALPRVLPTEGGHADFAGRDAFDARLRERLAAEHGHVSVERVVSGPGLVAIYDFIVGEDLAVRSGAVAAARAADEDVAQVIGERGLGPGDPACRFALERFVVTYGAEAGNFALKTLPFGGVFVAGGIAAKILPLIESGVFMTGFLDKGRMRRVLERVPVHVVRDPHVGLLGARRLALARAERVVQAGGRW